MDHPSDTPEARIKSRELLHRPDVVRALLEEDQLVAFKQRTRIGRRKMSPQLLVLLWLLRFYVVAMMLIVLLQVIRALHH